MLFMLRSLVIYCPNIALYCFEGYVRPRIHSTINSLVVLRYVFVLDIYCQQLWKVVQSGVVSVPFGHRVEECTFYSIGVVNVGGDECRRW